MINCADFLAELNNYLEGDIAEQLRRELESHLAVCRTCTVLLDSSRKTLTVITDAGSFELQEKEFRPVITNIISRIREGKV